MQLLEKLWKMWENIGILNLVSERNYHTTKFFTKFLLAIEIKKKTKKNRNTYELICVFTTFNIKIK